jgi:hypothetical protein
MVLPVRVVWPKEQKQVVSQLPFSRSCQVCVFGRVSCPEYLVCSPCHMHGRKTRKCKETIQQVKERLVREQANRTKKRLEELLDLREERSDSDSEESQDDSIDENLGSLSLVRRDLYLGLLCLLLLIVLQAYWVSSTFLRK